MLPILEGKTSLYELNNYWSVGDLYKYHLNRIYEYEYQERELEKSQKELESKKY